MTRMYFAVRPPRRPRFTPISPSSKAFLRAQGQRRRADHERIQDLLLHASEGDDLYESVTADAPALDNRCHRQRLLLEVA